MPPWDWTIPRTAANPKPLPDLFVEIGADPWRLFLVRAENDRRVYGLNELGPGDVLRVQHPLQNVIAAAPGGIGIQHGAVRTRPIADAGDHSGLRQVEVLGVFAEVKA